MHEWLTRPQTLELRQWKIIRFSHILLHRLRRLRWHQAPSILCVSIGFSSFFVSRLWLWYLSNISHSGIDWNNVYYKKYNVLGSGLDENDEKVFLELQCKHHPAEAFYCKSKTIGKTFIRNGKVVMSVLHQIQNLLQSNRWQVLFRFFFRRFRLCGRSLVGWK